MSAADREKWNAKYAEGAPDEPSAVLRSLSQWLPKRGRVLDVAGGAGRHAIWLAERGLDVTLADISPVGLALAEQRAAKRGVSLTTLETDLEAEGLPAGPWDAIVSVCFLRRDIMYAALPHVLAPEGMLIIVQPTQRNLERHEKPPRGFLLKEGELRERLSSLALLHYVEDWQADDRHDAGAVAALRQSG